MRSEKIARMFFPADDRVYYSVTFPRFTVDTRGSTRIRVRGLPTDATFYYSLASQEPTNGGVYIDRRRVPWLKVVLRFVATDEHGRALHSERLTVRDLNWAFHFTQPSPRRASSTKISALSKALRGRSDFDIVVTVETPSARPGDFMALEAVGEAPRAMSNKPNQSMKLTAGSLAINF
ncbi:MAG: hypothetical protein H0W20_12140 [Chthoniobacterales bacterium]|nr:hypothetical protein [Chthoniobacterales bacterium]